MLSQSTDYTFANDRIFLVGFGSTDGTRTYDIQRKLKYTELKFSRHLDGGTAPGGIVLSPSGWSSSGVCFGDSGGPTLALSNGRYYQIGVNSHVGPNAKCGSQSILAETYGQVATAYLNSLMQQARANSAGLSNKSQPRIRYLGPEL